MQVVQVVVDLEELGLDEVRVRQHLDEVGHGHAQRAQRRRDVVLVVGAEVLRGLADRRAVWKMPVSISSLKWSVPVFSMKST